MEVCKICENIVIEDDTTLTRKGCETINEVSLGCGGKVIANIGDKVHEKCRREFVSENHIKSRLNSNLDSNNNNNEFNFETCCFFCGKKARLNERKLDKNVDEINVTNEFLQTVKNASEKRLKGDEWTQIVLSRISSVPDLVGVKIVFHQNCRIGFRTKKPLPKDRSSVSSSFNYKNKKGFMDIVNLIRSKTKAQYSINELIDEMNVFSDGNAYSFNQMKTNLLQYFGNEIVISTHKNNKTLVTLTTTCFEILNDFYESSKSETVNHRAIRKVSDIILHDIKHVPCNKSYYPLSSEISLKDAQSFLPESLFMLLSRIITGFNAVLKIVSIGQAIIQTAHRENVMSPLQLALAVQMHYYTGSKFVVNTLNAFGFCCTYAEAKKFELCAAIALHDEQKNSTDNIPVIKYVADNVDHNLRTLDGKNTFHGMGIISIHPPLKTAASKIPRVNASLQDVRELGSVEIIPYFKRITPTTSLFYRKLNQIIIQDPYSDLDFLWKISWSKDQSNRPGWSGMMQMVQHGSHTGKPTVNFLAIIDMDPNDFTCINSTLHFICKNANKYNATPTVTFDQPLYWKSRTIIENEPVSSPIKRIVICLGGFHMTMSFLGTIGHIMTGTGLDVALAQVYAENTVIHMLSGKAYARAIRGLFLVDSALYSIILDDILNDELSSEVVDLLKSTLDGRQDIDKLQENGVLKQIKLSFTKKKESLKSDSNSRVWLQFMDMMDILRSSIRADRTGNFKLDLETMQRMLPFFAASGHNLYTKSVYIFLQDMLKLSETNPVVFEFFNDGNFITRRTDRFWAGLPDDLIIEQMLMRSLKVMGGLTRGRGMDDAKRALWLFSLPARAELNNAIQNITNLKTETSDQHKECGESRLIRDNKDIECIYNFLKERNPFASTTPNEFRNIADGIISTSNANVDKADDIGMKIIQSLEDKNVFEHSFERCKQVVRMSSKNELVIDGEIVTLDPDTLFQRLLFLILQSDRNEADKEAAFCYELCHKSPSLFDQSGLMRETNPSALLKFIVKKIGNVVDIGFIEKLPNLIYVLEGDWMLHKIPWRNGESFEAICDRYTTYVRDKFGKAAIVFDWNNSPSTNDESWLRETKGALGMEVVFNADTELKIKKEMFLRNKKNKRKFIELLMKKLQDNGFSVHINFDDFTVKIANVAVEFSKSHNTTVVGNRADLITVLAYYALPDNFSMFHMYEETAKKPLQVFNVSKLKSELGEYKLKHLLFAHAMGGCMTTSQLQNINKAALFNKLENDHFADLADIFCCPNSSQESIIKAGNEVIASLYNGKSDETLNKLRYRKFDEKARRGTTKPTCKSLPPTEAAAKFHSLRVFYQIQVWMQHKLNPFNFGWTERNCILRPITTNLPSAPADILSKIRCGCKGDCDSNRCSCYSVGLRCTAACKICAGDSCSNHPPIDNDSDSDEEF